MNFKKLTLTLALVSSFAATAETIKSLSKKDAEINVAQVQNAFVLKKPTLENNTRISLIVHDGGGTTDVSPTLGLYLIFWKDGEMNNATASFHLEETFSVLDYKVLANNKLMLKLRDYGDQGMFSKTVIIDYSNFAQKFEKDASHFEEEFVTKWVQGSIVSETLK